jgi:hypothetical protein
MHTDSFSVEESRVSGLLNLIYSGKFHYKFKSNNKKAQTTQAPINMMPLKVRAHRVNVVAYASKQVLDRSKIGHKL